MRIPILIAVAAATTCVQMSAASAETIYRRGMFTLNIQGISLPPPEQGVTGPFVFTQFDLDTATHLTKSLPTRDIVVGADVRGRKFSFSVPNGGKIAAMGFSPPPTYQSCVQALATSTRSSTDMFPPVTSYYCVRTTEGRIARFRINSADLVSRPQNMADLYVHVECRVWNP